MAYGKLLYGGVTRYRLLTSTSNRENVRRAGERTETKSSDTENVKSWLQYGGPPRKYEAVDMGPAAVLEILLLPRGIELPSAMEGGGDVDEMSLSKLGWDPCKMFHFATSDSSDEKLNKSNNSTANEKGQLDSGEIEANALMSMSGKSRNDYFETSFASSVGGLQKEIQSIVRRVLDGRVIRPYNPEENENDNFGLEHVAASTIEAEELASLGLAPVKGLLLYGPPGCGKTALAREISKNLRARPPKIVSAPELLNRYVGGSEKLIRQLFSEAEAELTSCGNDASKSSLHVVVIDEIDAVFRKRSTSGDSGEVARSSAVNQILAKLDGVKSISNVLLIGMTNKRELLDDALLRPGRLEVQIEIPLPNRIGRREILKIHFDALRKFGRLSEPLCCAIDGLALSIKGIDKSIGDLKIDNLTKIRKRDKIKNSFGQAFTLLPRFVQSRKIPDLSAEHLTGGFSGADIAGLVRCAGSIALERARKDGSGVEGLLITLEDVMCALEEVKK
mmetsp:Transcript_2507/g.2554  ORF Transcript_2507/g.2554 Transcript_2507/m.2554 type:complete len:505 (-) Transcript_2507:216-1730(-)